MADAKGPKSNREAHLSKDGKWRSFSKVPGLLQYVCTGTYFARAKVGSNNIRASLETDVFTKAKLKLAMFDGSPATNWLLRHHLVEHATPFQSMDADATVSTAQRLEKAMKDGKLDITSASTSSLVSLTWWNERR